MILIIFYSFNYHDCSALRRMQKHFEWEERRQCCEHFCGFAGQCVIEFSHGNHGVPGSKAAPASSPAPPGSRTQPQSQGDITTVTPVSGRSWADGASALQRGFQCRCCLFLQATGCFSSGNIPSVKSVAVSPAG